MTYTGSRPVVKAQGDPSISAGSGRGKSPPIRHWMKQGDAIELVIGGIQYDTICSHPSCPGGRKGCWAKFLVLPSLPRTCIRSSMFCCVLILWTLVWLCLISYLQGLCSITEESCGSLVFPSYPQHAMGKRMCSYLSQLLEATHGSS